MSWCISGCALRHCSKTRPDLHVNSSEPFGSVSTPFAFLDWDLHKKVKNFSWATAPQTTLMNSERRSAPGIIDESGGHNAKQIAVKLESCAHLKISVHLRKFERYFFHDRKTVAGKLVWRQFGGMCGRNLPLHFLVPTEIRTCRLLRCCCFKDELHLGGHTYFIHASREY